MKNIEQVFFWTLLAHAYEIEAKKIEAYAYLTSKFYHKYML